MTKVDTIPPPDAHVAACGLFCTNCGAFRRGRCSGCQVAPFFASCPVRQCCKGQGISNCASCGEFRAPRDYHECKKLNNWIARFFGLIFRSNRIGGLTQLRDEGLEAYLAVKRADPKKH